MIYWTEDYQRYLIWAVYHMYDYLYLLEFLNQEEMESLMFGYFMCEVGK